MTEAKTYLGAPCAAGHVGERYSTNRNCVECARAARQRGGYDKVKEAAYKRRYRAALKAGAVDYEALAMAAGWVVTDSGEWRRATKPADWSHSGFGSLPFMLRESAQSACESDGLGPYARSPAALGAAMLDDL